MQPLALLLVYLVSPAESPAAPALYRLPDCQAQAKKEEVVEADRRLDRWFGDVLRLRGRMDETHAACFSVLADPEKKDGWFDLDGEAGPHRREAERLEKEQARIRRDLAELKESLQLADSPARPCIRNIEATAKALPGRAELLRREAARLCTTIYREPARLRDLRRGD